MDILDMSPADRTQEPRLYNVRIAWGYIEYIREHHPEVDISSILEHAGISPLDFKDPGFWFTQEQADRFGDICIKLTGNPDIPRESGRLVANGDSFTSIRQFFLGFLTPCAASKGAAVIGSKLNRGVTIASRKLGKNKVEIVCRPKEGANDKPRQCKNRIGFIEGLGKLFTGKYARVGHPECVHRGDPHCRYIVSWDHGLRYYLNMMRSYGLAAILVLVLSSFFVLSYRSWLELSLALLVLFMGFCLFKSYLERRDQDTQIRDQAETANLFLREVDSKHDNAALIQEVGTAISSACVTEEVLDMILEGLKEHMDIERAIVLLFSEKNPGRIELVRGYGISLQAEDDLRRRLFRTMNTVLPQTTPFIVDTAGNMPEGLGELFGPVAEQTGISSFIVAPIVFRHEPTGFLIIDPAVSRRGLDRSDMDLITGIARQIAVIVHQSRLFRQLRQYEQNYRILVENASEGVVVIRNETCIYANSKIQDISGFSVEDLVPGPALNFIHPEDRKTLDNLHGQMPGRPVKRGEQLRLIRKDNAIRWIETSRFPISWENSEAVLFFIRDITEAKEARDALEHMNQHLENMVEKRSQELVQSSEQLMRETASRKRADAEKMELAEKLDRSKKMETLGMLAGRVAHGLNNILTGIVTYPELILLGLPGDSPMRGPIQLMRDSGLKAAAIVEDLLILASQDMPGISLVNVNKDVVLEFLESQECLRLKNTGAAIRVKTELDPDLHPVKGSLTHLRKTLTNLFINAVEAQPEGGRITITTKNRFVGSPLPGYDTIRKGSYVVLKISDNGFGILQEDIRKIFEPFFTKKNFQRAGTGLGMTVVWRTVHDHQGYITVQSEVGKGTCFEIYFPSAGKAAGKETGELPPVRDLMGSGETILVVDDIEQQRKIASEILKSLNYLVVTAASGEEAVAYLKSSSADLVLLDMIMDPGMDGLETYRRIIHDQPGQKAVIASGYAENIRVEEAIRLGVGKYIRKPYSIKNLGEVIKQVLASR